MAASVALRKRPLTALIAETAADTAEAKVAAVLARIDPEEYESYLRDAITVLVGHGNSKSAGRPTSTKQTLIREQYWPQFLRQRIFLPTGHKTMAEATIADLRGLASQRKAQASELTFRAQQFDQLAALMEEKQLTYLEQLDPATGQRALEHAE